MRIIEIERMHAQVAMKDQRDHVNPEAERFCREERLATEFRIVSDGNFIRGKAAREKRGADMAELDLSPDFLAEGGFNLWAELVGIYEKRRDNQNQQNNNDDDTNDDERLFRARHSQATEGAPIITQSAEPRLVQATLFDDHVLAHNEAVRRHLLQFGQDTANVLIGINESDDHRKASARLY